MKIRLPPQFELFSGGLNEIILQGTKLKNTKISLKNKYPLIHDNIFDSSGKVKGSILLFADNQIVERSSLNDDDDLECNTLTVIAIASGG
jgi:hypothetical protein